MFYYIEGTVTVLEPGLAVVDAGGVGYACRTTTTTLSGLQTGKKARLYTYLNVREDAMELYGFGSVREKGCFEQLLSVSGVGPKAALAILSSSTPENLALAIATSNEKALTAAPGVGKKLAQRIILELKDKLAKEMPGISASAGPAPQGSAPGAVVSEASAALAVLGYTPAEITNALRGMNTEGMTTEQIIRAVLKGSVK